MTNATRQRIRGATCWLIGHDTITEHHDCYCMRCGADEMGLCFGRPTLPQWFDIRWWRISLWFRARFGKCHYCGKRHVFTPAPDDDTHMPF